VHVCYFFYLNSIQQLPNFSPKSRLAVCYVLGTALKQLVWFHMTYRIIKITEETNYSFMLPTHSWCEMKIDGVQCKKWCMVESSWNVMAHGDTLERKWRGNWRMEWVAITLHTTSEHGVSSITTTDAHNSAASSRLNWRPPRFKWTRPLCRKTKTVFFTCAITFQTQSDVLFNLLKPGGYVMCQKVENSRILHSASLYLCVLYLPKNK
jgi:hypothetical protein